MDAELLKQALLLTAIGMGMTFAAIGALVLGMYVLGGIRPRKPTVAEAADEEDVVPTAEIATTPVTADARYLAAVAAVAVARAQGEGLAGEGLASVRGDRRSSGVVVDQWRSHVRSRHLTRRDYGHS